MAVVGNVSLAAEAGSHVGVLLRLLSRAALRLFSNHSGSGNNTNASALTSGPKKLHQLGLVAASLQFVEERSELLVTHIRQGFARSGFLVV